MAGKGSSTFNISLRLLDQNFKKGISGIQKQIRGLGNFIRGAFALGSVTAFGRQVVQVYRDFEDGMARVQAVSKASANDLKMMSDEAKRLGATTRYTASEAAGALENLTRNGMSASQATQALSGTLKFAQANAIGLAESADIVSNTLNMFGLEVTEVTRVTDVLSAVASSTATNVTEIYAALVNAAPAATVLGFSIEETTAAIGALAQRGVKAEQAGTALRMAFTKMVDPKIVAKMQEMGVAIDEESMKSEGLLGTIKRLKDANLSLADLVEIFSQRGAVGIQQLIGVYDELEISLRTAESAAGTTERMFTMGVGSTKQAIETLKSTYESFLLSLGTKTSGVVNGVIKLLTDLIKNFDTLGGTIANISSVIVPLFAKRATTALTTFVTAAKKAGTIAAGFKVTLGGWVTIISTVVTWIGTHLVTAWNRAHAAQREVNKLMGETDRASGELNIAVRNLINDLGKGNESLNSVVQTACNLFPEFAESIRRAEQASRDSNDGFEKLKNTLLEICELQNYLNQLNTSQKIYDAYLEQGATLMLAKGTEMGLQPLMDYMKNHGFSEELQRSVMKQLLDARARLGKDLADKLRIEESIIRNYTNGAVTGINFNSAQGGLPEIIGNLRATNHTIDDLNASIKGLRNTIERQDLESKARNLGVKFDDSVSNEDLKTRIKNAEVAQANLLRQQQEAAGAAEDFEEKITAVETSLKNGIASADNDFKLGINGIKTFGDYANKVYQLWVRAYTDFRALTGKEDDENPYYSGMMSAKESLGLEQPRTSSNFQQLLKEANRVTNTKPDAGGIKPRTSSNPTPDYVPDWRDYAIYTDEAIALTGTFTNSLSSLQSAFDTLSSSDATWIDRLSAAQRVLETMEDAILGVVKIIGDLGDTELLASKKEAIASALSRKNKKKDIAADTTKAVTGAAASQSGIPYIGPILAVAAVAGILALIAASSQKFASGGIVQGNTKYGDKLLARVNAGEAILNQRQQKRLLDIADGRGGNGGQQVQFFISGKDLVGVIRNNNAAASRITGSKGM